MPKRWIKLNLTDVNSDEYARVVDDVRDVLQKSGDKGWVEQDGKQDAVGDS